MNPDPYRFFHRLRVRWGECDMQGIVFNPHYMAYVDVALTEYWRAINLPYPQAFAAEACDIFMVAASQAYRDAARFDDLLDIGVRVDYFGTTSFRIAFDLRRDATTLVDGLATYVNGDRTTRRPKPLGDALMRQVTAFETTAPARKQG